MIKTIGSWGRTIFRLRPQEGVRGATLILRQREGKVEIGLAELSAIAAFVDALEIDYRAYIPVLKKRLDG